MLAELARSAMRFPSDSSLTLVPLAADTIRARAPAIVTRSETLDYRTMMPERGGLFDPKLFGPGTVIDAPPPAADAPLVPRKTSFARLPLAAPVLHPLFVGLRDRYASAIGATAEDILAASTGLARGRELARVLDRSELRDLVLRELPILPPDLRPLRRDDDDRWATTPINTWYQRIVGRNARLAKLVEDDAPGADTQYRELATTIRCLFENDELPADRALDAGGAALPSLRTLCGGTAAWHAALANAAEPFTGAQWVARQVLFAHGFELAA